MTAKAKPAKKEKTPPAESTKGETDKKESRIVERPTLEVLPVALTGAEITQYAKESARLHGDLSRLEQERKDVAADFKARMSALETRITELNRKIESGNEHRQVACFWRIDYDKGKKTLFRTPATPNEKAEEVTSYNLSPDERQMKLPIAETKNDTVAQTADENLARMNAEDSTKHGPQPGDQTGTDDVRTPAAESPEETKIRKWFNSLTIDGRKVALDIAADAELSADQTALPYKRLPEIDKDIIRKNYRAQTADSEGREA